MYDRCLVHEDSQVLVNLWSGYTSVGANRLAYIGNKKESPTRDLGWKRYAAPIGTLPGLNGLRKVILRIVSH